MSSVTKVSFTSSHPIWISFFPFLGVWKLSQLKQETEAIVRLNLFASYTSVTTILLGLVLSSLKIILMYMFSSVQFSRSVVSDSLRPHESQHARPPSPSPTPSQSSLRLTSIESRMPSSHLILCRPLLLLSPIPPSIRVFSNESTLHMKWPKYWSFSFSIIPFKEIPGLISFRMDWLDLLAVQGTLKSLLQHHSSKASIFQRSAIFTVQLSHH